jgi:Ca-activated chloride channel family protein
MAVELFLSPLRRMAGGDRMLLTGSVLFLILGLLTPGGVAAGPLEEGVAAYDRGAYETALKHFIDAQLDDPDRPDILYNIGNAYYKLGDYAAALTHYQQALEKNPVDLAGKALYNKGNAHFRNNDYPAALKAYESALKLNPDDQEAKENLRFVRKMMEQQQTPPSRQERDSGKESPEDPSQNESRQADQQNGKEQERRKGEQAVKPSEEEQTGAPRSPEYGDQMADGPETRPHRKEKEPEKREEDPRSGAASASPPENGAKKGTERVLNRLKDQPGKALMIPPEGYGRRNVERDW